jgi:hypothetical protein
VNEALAFYFLDATIASAFVARWCVAQRIEIVDGGISGEMTSRRPRSVRLCKDALI